MLYSSHSLGTQSWARPLWPLGITRNNNTAHILRPGLSFHTSTPCVRTYQASSVTSTALSLSILSSKGLYVAFDQLFWLTCKSLLSELILLNCLADFRSSFLCDLNRSWCQRKSMSVLPSTNSVEWQVCSHFYPSICFLFLRHCDMHVLPFALSFQVFVQTFLTPTCCVKCKRSEVIKE